MKYSILVIDDIQTQVENIERYLTKEHPDSYVMTAFEEADILKKINNSFFNIAIVDLKMDNFTIDGFKIIEIINKVSPLTRIIVVSAFVKEYISQLNEIIKNKNVEAIVDKADFKTFSRDISSKINDIVSDLEKIGNVDTVTKLLFKQYSNLLVEDNSYKKGQDFESFVSFLFSLMGFTKIYTRVIDKSRNELDIIIRNDIDDSFFNKFKQYLLIECKNKPEDGVSKNDYIVFHTKLKNTNGMSSLGFLFTTGKFKSTTYIEAVRESKSDHKVIFIGNNEIKDLIFTSDKLSKLKEIIDHQVKDN